MWFLTFTSMFSASTHILVCSFAGFPLGSGKDFFIMSVEFLHVVSYVFVPPMFSFACALFYSPNSLKSRTRIISRGKEIIVSV